MDWVGLIKYARGTFTSWCPISPKRRIANCHETIRYVWYMKYIKNTLQNDFFNSIHLGKFNSQQMACWHLKKTSLCLCIWLHIKNFPLWYCFVPENIPTYPMEGIFSETPPNFLEFKLSIIQFFKVLVLLNPPPPPPPTPNPFCGESIRTAH